MENPNLENNLRVADLFAARYASTPFGRAKNGAPLVLSTAGEDGDHNAQRIRQRMDEVYANAAWTLQGLLDILANTDTTLEFKKTLKWQIKPGWTPPVEAPPPAAPTVKDTRTKTQKLQDLGIAPITHKKTVEDERAEQQRHQEARDRLKKLFHPVSPEQAAFRKKLHDIAVYQEITNGRINRTSTYREREQMRQELRKEYPAFADQVVTPESERPDVKF
jgi:hypothetical protein